VGVYNFPTLQPGPYQLTGEAVGFQKLVYNDIQLSIEAQLTINFPLRVQSGAEAVEVNAQSESVAVDSTATIGGVISNQRVNELPLPDHSVLGLLNSTAGVSGGGSNIDGGRDGALNLTLNGINVQGQRNDTGASATTFFNSVDLIDEVRVVTAPADAELGRGTGQVSLTMRSGANAFHGSAVESLRNTALNANDFFNNLNGIKRQILNRNQFAARLGGPIIKNKAFFFFLYEGQRQSSSSPTTQTVLTAQARQGIFRYFSGVRNGNVLAAVPTVDASGNPVQPAGGGALQSVNLFGVDPLRTSASAAVAALINASPLPNNFQAGDGLNTAGYQWNQPSYSNRDDYAPRIDYHFNDMHSLNFSLQRETSNTPYVAAKYPGSPTDSTLVNRSTFASLQFTSVITSTMVNAFSAGFQHPYQFSLAPPLSAQGNKLLAVAPNSGVKYIITPTSFTAPLAAINTTSKNVNPYYSVGDAVTKSVGRHTFKGGFEYHWLYSNSYNSNTNVTPQAVLGAGSAAVTGVSALPGIVANQTLAQNILTDLAGSVTSVAQTFIVGDSKNPQYLPGYPNLRIWESRESAGFFKDDFKLSSNLTVNLGVRWEYYGVPWEQRGVATGLVGGSAGLFGISGTNLAAEFQPGASGGSMTQTLPIGKNSPNSGQKLYADDWNNFAPAVGLSWSVPYWGKDKTVLRMGYSINYIKPPAFKAIDTFIDNQAGAQTNVTYAPSTYTSLSQISLPLTPTSAPFAVVPFTDRTQNVGAYDNNFRTGYAQNYNVSIQRELPFSSNIAVRLVGSKGSKLQQTFDINEANIFNNGILNAFQITQAGGDAPLFNQIFNGLNLGSGVVNGTTVTGSAALRANSTTAAFFANNDVGSFANYLNTTTNFTGVAGGILSHAGLPQNFVVVNPQYASSLGTPGPGATVGAAFVCSCVNSTYNSAIVEYSKRLSHGFGLLASYTYSKALGVSEGGTYPTNFRTIRNMSLDKHVLSFNENRVLKISGTYQLPFGPGKPFVNGHNPVLGRIAGGWQIGAIYTGYSGAPLSLTSATSSFNQQTTINTPFATQAFSPSTGQVQMVGNGVVYFAGLHQITDPNVANLTSLQGLQAKSTMLAIANAQGQPVLANATPGVLGNLAINFLTGPSIWNLDLNLLKNIMIREGLRLELRIDALNAPNNVQFSNPVSDINNINFGRITSTNGSSRVVVGNLRVTF